MKAGSLICLLFLVLTTIVRGAENEWATVSLKELEYQLFKVDSELDQLAEMSLRSGIGTIGYRSQTHSDAENVEWIQIEFEKVLTFDRIVVVPMVWRHVSKGFVSDAVPEEFRIIVGSTEDPDGVVIADEAGQTDRFGIAPITIDCPGQKASWVRIESQRLSPRHLDGKYIFQLAEVLVFKGQENLALHQSVTSSSSSNPLSRGWKDEYLVDGFMPYLMNAAAGAQSLPFVCRIRGEEPVSFTMDLGREREISRIHLHTIDPSDTVPQSSAGDLGFPRRLRIRGANTEDFSDSITLLECVSPSAYQVSPIMMWNIPATKCRYLRFDILEAFIVPRKKQTSYQLGFSEIQLFENGVNVAPYSSIRMEMERLVWSRPLENLIDGNNLYGEILSIREWLEQLTRRHELECLRPVLRAELNRRYLMQKTRLRMMYGISLALMVGILFLLLIHRLLRMREATAIRERFAADLHDEVGATNHAIGLLSDAANSFQSSDEKLKRIHWKIRELTEKNGNAIRAFSNMAGDKDVYKDFAKEIERIAERITAKLNHTFDIEGEGYLHDLDPGMRMDLFLFYKEALINACRHASATQIQTDILATSREIILTIEDNGKGLPNRDVPPSLIRRARFLKGQVSVREFGSSGTTIELKVNKKLRHLFPRVRRINRKHQ